MSRGRGLSLGKDGRAYTPILPLLPRLVCLFSQQQLVLGYLLGGDSCGGWMSRTYVFADEAGNDDFNLDKRDATRYFILTAVTLSDCAIGDQFIALRRQMAWDELDQ